MHEPRPAALFLKDIVDAATDIRSFTQGRSFEDFAADRRTVLAVIRCLEVVGEAVKNLPEGITGAHPEVDWRAATRMRDKLIHAYHGTSLQIVWDTITRDLPRFEEQVRAILEGLGREG